MRYSQELLEEIRVKNDLVEVVSEYVALKKTGKNYKALCPFHSEKTPSFTVNPDKQLFHCFGCGIGGNIYHFIMKMENITFPEAVEFLADRVGMTLPEKNHTKQSEKYKEKKRIHKINSKAAHYFYKNLVSSDEGKRALDYLTKRGIKPDTIKAFGLGYARREWDDLMKFLISLGYGIKEIARSGLIVARKGKSGFYDRFRNRIVFPIFDLHNNVIGFGGRVLDDSIPKYLNSPETEVFNKRFNLYGLNNAKSHCREKGLIIVEGYMDVISLYQQGIKNAAATLGTALTKEQARLIRRYTDRVYVGYDADEAGMAAAFRGLDILRDAGLDVRVIQLPSGLDPDDFIKEKGKEAFFILMARALPLMDFKIKVIKKGYDLNSVEDKNMFINEIIPHLIKIDSMIERDGYIKKISEMTDIQEEAIRMELRKHIRKNLPNYAIKSIKGKKWYNNKNKSNITGKGWQSAEKYLLKAMINQKRYFEVIKQAIKPEDFQDESNRQIAALVYDIYDKGEEVVFAISINEMQENLKNEISKLVADEDADIDENTVKGCIQRVKKEKINKQLKETIQQIKNCEKQGDNENLMLLLSKYKKLSKELKTL